MTARKTSTRKPAARKTPVAQAIDLDDNGVDVTEFYNEEDRIEVMLASASPKRQLAAFITWTGSLVMSFAAFNMVADLVAFALAGLSGAAFIMFCVWFIGLLLTIYFGLRSANALAVYVLSRGVDRDLARAKEGISSLWSRVTRRASEVTQ